MNAPPPSRPLGQLVALRLEGLTRAPIGPRPEQLWVKVSDLRIDRSYQRDLGARSRALIRRMVEAWDWTLVQAITVAELPGGLWELVDGQHRAVAAITHGGIAMLPATVITSINPRAAAAAFVALNSQRVQVTAGQTMRAAIAGGDPVALQVKAAADAAGAKLLFTRSGPIPAGATMAVGALRAVAVRRGQAALAEILAPCVTAQLAPIRSEHIKAVEAVLHEPEWSEPRATPAALATALRDWPEIADAADLARLDSGEPRSRALAVALHRRIAR